MINAPLVKIPGDSGNALSERERVILRAIVQLFILHAIPVGSRVVSQYLERELQLSAATIRNTMADLEAAGYIAHPHTSAGRMPTDKGYRYYVDSLMEVERISTHEADTMLSSILSAPREAVLREATRMLGTLSHHLALVEFPLVRQAIVEKVELITLSSERFLAVLALDSDLVRTVTLEWNGALAADTIQDVSRLINERLAGRPLSYLPSIVADIPYDSSDMSGLLRLFVEQVGRIADHPDTAGVHVAGAQNLLSHPEFEDPGRMRSIIELVENEDVIVHLLGSTRDDTGVSIRIGNELADQFADYSLVSTTYRIGTASGSVGLIGPKRMNYSRMISLVHIVSSVLSRTLSSR